MLKDKLGDLVPLRLHDLGQIGRDGRDLIHFGDELVHRQFNIVKVGSHLFDRVRRFDELVVIVVHQTLHTLI